MIQPERMELIFATGNPGKVLEAQQICDSLSARYGIQVTVRPMPDRADIPETGTTYEENSCQKASFVWEKYHQNCFADDSGLEVEALGGAPGIYTARYCGRNFENGIDYLLAQLSSLGAEDPSGRRANFECCICLILDGEVHSFRGHCPGRISAVRCGQGGFGYDPVFIADATPDQCMAQLDSSVKNRVSHRALALEEMFRYLSEREGNLK